MGIQTAHLCNAAGVVGDGTVGINSNRDAGGGQHTDGGQCDAVQVVRYTVRNPDPNADQQNRHPGTHHADGNAADDGGGGTGFGLVCNALDGIIISGGVYFRHVSNDKAHDNAGDDRQGIEKAAKETQAQRNGNNRHNTGRHIRAHLQRRMGVGVVLAAHKEGGNDAGRNAKRRNQQGIEGARSLEGTGHGNAEGQGGDQRAHVTLKEVGAHACNVTHVVAYIIGDNGGVPRVIFRDTGFHFAHQVGAHVCGFGIDAATHTGKQRDG